MVLCPVLFELTGVCGHTGSAQRGSFYCLEHTRSFLSRPAGLFTTSTWHTTAATLVVYVYHLMVVHLHGISLL